MTGELSLELNCRTGGTEDFARSAAAWLTEAGSEFFPESEAGLAAQLAARSRPDLENPYTPWGPPHGVYAQLLVQPTAQGPDLRLWRYSRRNWHRLMNSLGTSPPYVCTLLMHLLDARGRPKDPFHGGAVSVEFERVPDHPEWARFAVSAPASQVPWRDSEEVQQRWLDLLAAWAVRLDAAYGHLTDDASTTFGTALERNKNRCPEDTVPDSDRILRDYAWGTVCSPEVAARVGGPQALRSSGAFHEVAELPGGRLLLRATPRLEQYAGDALSPVLRALAPALPDGRTHREYVPSWMRLVPDGDPADYR